MVRWYDVEAPGLKARRKARCSVEEHRTVIGYFEEGIDFMIATFLEEIQAQIDVDTDL